MEHFLNNFRDLKKKKRDGIKYKGVRKQFNRYAAQIRDPITKKNVQLGVFDTQELAAYAYDFAAKRMRGARARTNFVHANSELCCLSKSPASAPTSGIIFSNQILADPTTLEGSLPNSAIRNSVCNQSNIQIGFDPGYIYGDMTTGNCIESSTVQMEKDHKLLGGGGFSPTPISSSQSSSVSMNIRQGPSFNTAITVSTTPILPDQAENHSFLPEGTSFPNNSTTDTLMPNPLENCSFSPLSNKSFFDNTFTPNMVCTTPILPNPVENSYSFLQFLKDPGLDVSIEETFNSVCSNKEQEIQNPAINFYTRSSLCEKPNEMSSNSLDFNTEHRKENVADSMYPYLDLFEQNNILLQTNSIVSSSAISSHNSNIINGSDSKLDYGFGIPHCIDSPHFLTSDIQGLTEINYQCLHFNPQQHQQQCEEQQQQKHDISQLIASYDQYSWLNDSEPVSLLKELLESIPDIPNITTLSEVF